MSNRNETFNAWGTFLGGIGLLLMGVGAIALSCNKIYTTRAFTRHMESYPSQIVADMMSTNGPDQFSMEDEDGHPWITIENADKTKANFYRISETNSENRRDVISFLRSQSVELETNENQGKQNTH
jgi:hypothetical protein